MHCRVTPENTFQKVELDLDYHIVEYQLNEMNDEMYDIILHSLISFRAVHILVHMYIYVL